MRISVVTPSYNQGEFLERCLASVRRQKYAPAEHFVYDPGSTDASRAIAAAAPGVTLIAEPDGGQGDAVAKGMLRASGDIVAWLNSDDEYADENVFAAVAEAFASSEQPDIVYGRGDYTDRDGRHLRPAYVISKPEELHWRLCKEVGILQPATFISKKLIQRIGPVSKDYHFCLDYEFWIRAMMAGAKFHYLDRLLAHARYYPDNKTLGQRGESLIEVIGMVKSKFGFVHHDWIRRLADFRLNNNDGILRSADRQGQDAVRLARHATELNYLIHGDFDSASAFLGSKSWDMKHFTAEDFKSQAHRFPGEYATPVAIEAAVTPGCETVLVGQRRWAFRNSWLRERLAESADRIDQLAATRTTDTCIIVGNGPSLNATRLDLLEGHDVFITNYSILSSKLRRLAKYLCVTNYLVAEQGAYAFNTLERIHKIVPYWLSYCILPTPLTHYVRSIGTDVFSTNFRLNVSWRSSVSFFAMQMAYALGYRKVLLIGFDHFYNQPKAAEEGVVIRQEEDDANHFDPRYFKGKDWQAADTAKMEAVFLRAREAFEADGREIVNCTEGGRLEVFRRGRLADELGERPIASATPEAPVRLLILDMTPAGNGTATGQLKQALFGGIGTVATLQICAWGDGLGLAGQGKARSVSAEEAGAAIDRFAPDMILYRPTPDAPVLHEFAMQQIFGRAGIPLAVWIMDDWPEQMKTQDPQRAKALDADWRALLDAAAVRLSVSEQMSAIFRRRYGVDFVAVANGVVREDWRRKSLLVRYGGGLSPSMGLESVRRVAEAVEALGALGAEGVDARFEILTRKHWREAAEGEFAGFPRTSFRTDVLPDAEYRAWLMGADVLAICYNFDEASKAYVRHSMANKLPECLASGAVVLAHGPESVATIARAKELECTLLVSDPSLEKLVDGLKRVVDEPEWAAALTARAQRIAFERFGLDLMQERLLAAIRFGLRASRRNAAPAGPEVETLEQVSRRLDAILASLNKI